MSSNCGPRLGAIHMRVLIAHSDPVLADTLMTEMGRDDRIEIVGHATDGQEALALAQYLLPDMVLIDIEMPVLDGIEAARRIREDRSGACVLMLTGGESIDDLTRARAAGVAGFVAKDRIATELMDMIFELASFVVALAPSA